MSICTFTVADFEAALPHHKETGAPMCRPLGLVQGEFAYLMPVDEVVAIMIRSSIGASGTSAGAGEDSIRAWLIETPSLNPLGSKVTRWVTRQPGWQQRLDTTLRKLWSWRKATGDCRVCQQPLVMFRNHATKEVFARCRNSAHQCASIKGRLVHSFTLSD